MSLPINHHYYLSPLNKVDLSKTCFANRLQYQKNNEVYIRVTEEEWNSADNRQFKKGIYRRDQVGGWHLISNKTDFIDGQRQETWWSEPPKIYSALELIASDLNRGINEFNHLSRDSIWALQRQGYTCQYQRRTSKIDQPMGVQGAVFINEDVWVVSKQA